MFILQIMLENDDFNPTWVINLGNEAIFIR